MAEGNIPFAPHPANASEFHKNKVIVVNESEDNDKISGVIEKNLEQAIFNDKEDNPEQGNYHIVNVMKEILRKKNLYQYMQKEDMCTCERCQADVLALCLTRLPAKYLVMYEQTTSPMVSYYESRYRSQILATILRSCEDVKKTPHHDKGAAYNRKITFKMD